jgi:membrane protease YdiL (CAAX protease family)
MGTTRPEQTAPPSAPRLALAGTLVVALTLPTVIAWLYFVALAGSGERSAIQQGVYAAGKVVQFGLPVLFVLAWERRWPRRPEAPLAGAGIGLAFGLAVALAMFALYHLVLRDSTLLAGMPDQVRQKVRELGVDSPGGFLALAVFLAGLHSLLEEYYWRWFVHGRLRELVPAGVAIAVSSLGFMSHHVIVLGVYLPGQLWTAVVPFSLGIAVGGAFWAWLYERSGSLVAPWLSHAIVDVAIFVIGWDLITAR